MVHSGYRRGARATRRSPRLTNRRSTMANPNRPRLSQISADLKDKPTSLAQSEKLSPRSDSSSPAPKCINVPQRLLRLEQREQFWVINDDPVFEARDAAFILGISVDLLEKWRQRGYGPAYLQYGGLGGPVRYPLSELNAFKAACRVDPSHQLLKGRR